MIEVPPDPSTGVLIGIALILGPGDGGKTTMAAALARAWVPAGQEERLIVVGPVQKLAEMLGVPNHPVDTKDKRAQDVFFHQVNELEGAYLIAVDEADLYYSMGGRTYGSKEFQELINIGRNFGKSLILCARGTSDLAKNTINQARVVMMCRTLEPNLLDYAERYMAEIPDVRNLISNLEPHEFIVWCPKMNPRWQGGAKVVNGQIYLIPPEAFLTTPTASERSTDSEEPGSPDDTAPSPDAERSSPTASGPISATTISPTGSGNESD